MKEGQLRIIDGDLLDQAVEVIVNAWNRNIIPWWLLLPQGVSGAIKLFITEELLAVPYAGMVHVVRHRKG